MQSGAIKQDIGLKDNVGYWLRMTQDINWRNNVGYWLEDNI